MQHFNGNDRALFERTVTAWQLSQVRCHRVWGATHPLSSICSSTGQQTCCGDPMHFLDHVPWLSAFNFLSSLDEQQSCCRLLENQISIYWPSCVTPSPILCQHLLYWCCNCLIGAKPMYTGNTTLIQKWMKYALTHMLMHFGASWDSLNSAIPCNPSSLSVDWTINRLSQNLMLCD